MAPLPPPPCIQAWSSHNPKVRFSASYEIQSYHEGKLLKIGAPPPPPPKNSPIGKLTSLVLCGSLLRVVSMERQTLSLTPNFIRILHSDDVHISSSSPVERFFRAFILKEETVQSEGGGGLRITVHRRGGRLAIFGAKRGWWLRITRLGGGGGCGTPKIANREGEGWLRMGRERVITRSSWGEAPEIANFGNIGEGND